MGFSNITDFGAVGDGETVNTEAIQAAIDECTGASGGVVEVPAGDFLIGTIQLKDGVELRLESGARLLGSTDAEHYDAPVSDEIALVIAKGATDIAITGQGTIHGQGDAFAEPMNEAGDWPREPREFRPDYLVHFNRCEDVLLRDFTIEESSHWTVHFLGCENVEVASIDIENDPDFPNNDGINPDGSSNVDIHDCRVRACDDGIAIKNTGRDGYEGATENVTVTNCLFSTRSTGVKIGTETANDIRNVVVQNCVIRPANRGLGIILRDAGTIENVSYDNVVIETHLHTGHTTHWSFVESDSVHETNWAGKSEPIEITALHREEDQELIGGVRNVRFSNITADSEGCVFLRGCAESVIENVDIVDMNLTLRETDRPEYGGFFDLWPRPLSTEYIYETDIPAIYAGYVQDLDVENVDVRWVGDGLPDYHSHALHAEHSDDVTVDGLEGRQAHSDSVLRFEAVGDATVRNCKATDGAGTFLSLSDVDSVFMVGNDLASATEAIADADSVDSPIVDAHANRLPRR